MRSQDELAEQLTALVLAVLTLMLLLCRGAGEWACRLLARAFRYWPHRALVIWTLAVVPITALTVVLAVLTTSPFAWASVALVVAFALLSLAALEAVLRHVANNPAPAEPLDLPDFWSDTM